MCCVFLSLPHHHLFFHQINPLSSSSNSSLPLPPSLSLSIFSCFLQTLSFLSCILQFDLPFHLKNQSNQGRMYSSSSALLKQEFFKKWIKGLQIYSSFNKEMTILERKKAIKLSADVAIASTRNAATHWSKALAASAAAADDAAARIVVEEVLGRKLVDRKALMITCSKKIVRRSRAAVAQRRVVRSRAGASSIARKLVRNRTRVLKRLVPGGRKLDEISLIKETLDYIASLQVQVDVMRHLASAAEMLDQQQRSF